MRSLRILLDAAKTAHDGRSIVHCTDTALCFVCFFHKKPIVYANKTQIDVYTIVHADLLSSTMKIEEIIFAEE